MGRKSVTSCVRPKGKSRIEFDLEFEGKRYRPTVQRAPTEGNLRRALQQLKGIRGRIENGTFCFADEFPGFRDLAKIDTSGQVRSCNDVFDEFLKHCESRMAKNDMAFVTMDGYRKILKQVWRPAIGKELFEKIRYSRLAKIADSYKWSKKTYNNALSALRCAFEYGYRDFPEKHNPASALKCLRITKKDRPVIDPFTIHEAEALIAAIHRDWGEPQGNYDEFRFFTGLRPSEQIALRVTDCDVAQGKIKIERARVVARDKDRTKTSEDRIVELCPRALFVLKRHLTLRARLKLEGKINHEDLFFKEAGTPIRNLQYPWVRWRRTLTVTLKGRYREPYNARHSSVSWNLMIGVNPLKVAKQHGHSVQTMLETYAAWLDGTTESDLQAIKRAMEGPPAPTSAVRPAPEAEKVRRPFALSRPHPSPRAVTGLSLGSAPGAQLPDNWYKILAEREGFEPSKGF